MWHDTKHDGLVYLIIEYRKSKMFFQELTSDRLVRLEGFEDQMFWVKNESRN